jgi:hypothetical protein
VMITFLFSNKYRFLAHVTSWDRISRFMFTAIGLIFNVNACHLPSWFCAIHG